ncbi:MAG: hypothetical protein II504_12010 [Clostridia bacterium]|nr:hypothetical protein [Clostridia bacterium]
MRAFDFHQLSHEAQVLVQQALDHLSPCYDAERHLVYRLRNGKKVHENRASLYYALGILMTGQKDCIATAEALCHAVIDLQIDAPAEIFHGAYLHPGQKMPREGVLDYQRLGTYGRYYLDCFYERLADTFRLNLNSDPELVPYCEQIDQLLIKAALDVHPMVYATYEPCSREFLPMCFAMLLEYFENELSPGLVHRMERSAEMAVEGAIIRSRTDFSPMNTNIQCMHVFVTDYFGKRLGHPEYCRYALEYARSMYTAYRMHHAAAEFNSPTYCGVDLATLGFWRRYGSCHELQCIGAELEKGIWQDMMAFYNPAMRNFCGPYSRAYEMDMSLHTHFHALFYLALGEARFPDHPYSHESDSNPLLVLGSVCIPEDAQEAVFAPKPDTVIRRQFRELSERGDPEHNDALCTATAWISPRLMAGALSGSENPSYQLHPLVVFWRHGQSLGTIKLLRCLPNGRMIHLHTILFNGYAEKNHIVMDVNVNVLRDIHVFFEIECDDIAHAVITETSWELPGLHIALKASAPEMHLESVNARTLRVVYPAQVRRPETMTMHFDLQLFVDVP